MKTVAQLSHLVGPLAVLAWLLPGAAPLAARRPNVVVILTDDQGWGDLSCNGNQNLHTPHVDWLAKEGASFDRFYVCPVCSPTRAEFLTGRYHPRSGVYSTSAGGERIDLDEKTIADTFQAAGYRTAAFGKWHNGMQYPYHPNARGFGEYYGFCSGHWGNYFSPPLEHNGRIVRGSGFIVDDFTERAMKFFETHKDHPFFVYLPLNTPHSPMQVPDRWWNKFKDRDLKMHHRDPERENLAHIRAALAMCENIDWNVGRLLRKLAALQLADNTIVVYFCDNGPNGYRWNGGMKGRKGSTDEGGVRSPLLIRWPGRIEPGRKVTQISAAMDFLPTLAELADIPVVSTRPLDGVSLGPLLLENGAGPNRAAADRVAPPSWNRLIFSHWRERVSVRSQDYRLDHQGKLYDMAADPGQVEDISPQRPEVARQLRQSVANWKRQVLAEIGTEDRPFPIGHPDFPSTQLPARDARGHGNITRSNRFPNCSFFTNWTSLDDRITWNAEVLAAGLYEAEIYYTCPARDVGSTIELSFHGQNLRGQIAQTHDPPLRGGQHDRVARTESYVKDFKALKLGTIRLSAGRGELTLRAIQIAGSQVIDFRQLMLTRVDVP